MALTITLPPDVEARLQKEAKQQGLPIFVYVERLLLERLPPAEQSEHRRHWHDLRAKAPASLLGEDAQTWVTRLRREGFGSSAVEAASILILRCFQEGELTP
jgi:hypothetical protein